MPVPCAVGRAPAHPGQQSGAGSAHRGLRHGEQAPVDLAEMVVAAGQAASTQPPAQRTSSEGTSARRPASGSSGGKRRADERDTSSRPRVVLPMLRLAASRDETAGSSVSSGAEAGSAASRTSAEEVSDTEVTAVTPIITDDTPPPEPRRRRRKPEPEDASEETAEQPVWDINKPPFTTSRPRRHDTKHGSIAARSVLDRLGISPGKVADAGAPLTRTTGKRARWGSAAGAPPAGPPPRRTRPRTPAGRSGRGTRHRFERTGHHRHDVGHRVHRRGHVHDHRGDGCEGGLGAGDRGRLRLAAATEAAACVGSVEWESVSASSSQGSEQESGEARSVQSATTEHTEQFSNPGSSYGFRPTTRRRTPGWPSCWPGRAEHQAGSASAASLVRKLGVDDTQPRINGKHRGDG